MAARSVLENLVMAGGSVWHRGPDGNLLAIESMVPPLTPNPQPHFAICTCSGLASALVLTQR